MTTRYILTETVDYIFERFDYLDKSIGWFIRLEGSGESFYLSPTQPDLQVGDKLKITLEKTHA